jgi:hypothetical protein
MKGLKIVFYLILGFSSVSLCANSLNKPNLKLSVTPHNASVGCVVRLKINVEAENINSISWKKCDELFKETNQVILLDATTTKIKNGVLHEIVFTSINPIKWAVKGLPIVINGQIITTPPFFIKFKSSRLPLQLHSIKPVAASQFQDVLKSFLLMIFIILLSTLVLTALYFYTIKRVAKTMISKQRLHQLETIKTLEKEVVEGNISVAFLVEQIQQILQKYVVEDFDLEIQTNQLFELMEQASKIKFLPQPIGNEVYQPFLIKVKDFLIGTKSYV